jgi:hypothetical protein
MQSLRDNMMKGSKTPPASVTSMTINTIALMTSLLTAGWLLTAGANIAVMYAVLLIGAAYALPIVVLEAMWLAPHRDSAKRNIQQPVDVPRVLVKLLGLSVTLLLIVGVYSLFPNIGARSTRNITLHCACWRRGSWLSLCRIFSGWIAAMAASATATGIWDNWRCCAGITLIAG